MKKKNNCNIIEFHKGILITISVFCVVFAALVVKLHFSYVTNSKSFFINREEMKLNLELLK